MVKLNDIVKSEKYNNIIVKVNKIPVTIKTHISADDYASCVKTIVENCTVDNVFHPEFKEITKRYAYLNYFTDIDLSDYTGDEVFELSQASWYESIFKIISNLPVYYDIENAVEDIINNRKTSFDNLCDTLSATITQGNEINLAEVKTLLNELNKVDKKAFVNAVINKKRKK